MTGPGTRQPLTATVSIFYDGGVADVLVDEADRRNPLSPTTIHGLRAALDESAQMGSRVVVLRSAGADVFVAGADLRTLDDGARALIEADLYGMFEQIEQHPAPVIAAVQGRALGGGFELALVADLTVCAESASFTLPETTLGLAPGIAIVRLHRQVGLQQAKYLVLTNRTITAMEAHQLGLVVDVVAADALLERVFQLAHDIADRAPLGVQVTKAAMNRESSHEDWAYVRSVMATLFESRDLAEGLRAFREHRAPVFVGR